MIRVEVCFPKFYSPLANWPWLRISPHSSLFVIYCLIITAWQWLSFMYMPCIPMQIKPNKSPPKLARKDPPYKNRIPPAHEVNLCLELAHSHVLWSVLSLNKSALSPYAVNSVCSVQFFVHNHQEPGYLCPPLTIFGKPARRRCRSGKLPLLLWHPGMPLSVAFYSVLVSLMFPDGRSAAKLWIWVWQLKTTRAPAALRHPW